MTIAGASRWLERQPARGDVRLRLLCLPHAGGGTQSYRGFGEHLPDGVEVCAAVLPGRGGRFREPALDRVDAIVDRIVESLIPELDCPLAVFGHSLGAICAFELARRLRKHLGFEPVHLWLGGHRAPHLPYPAVKIHDLSDDKLVGRLRGLNGTPDEVFDSEELVKLLLPALRADFSAVETYEHLPEEPLACGLTIFGGVEDHFVDPRELHRWREHTKGPFAVRLLPGDHFFVHSERERVLRIVHDELSGLLARRAV